MAIKNVLLGGTDWVPRERLDNTDLNDTFNALYNKVNTLTAFWLNDELYDVYDDFNSYSVGAFTTNTGWSITTSNTGSASIVASTNAGGTTNELRLYATGNSTNLTGVCTATSNNLSVNKHKWCRARWVVSFIGGGSQTSTASLTVTIGSQSAVTVATASPIGQNGGSLSCYLDITVIAKGGGAYDVYAAGKQILTNVSDANPQLKISASGGGFTQDSAAECNCYIDDVRESKGTVE